jgi:AraC-like DNA-binding protein
MGEKSQNAAVVDGDVSASNAITPQDEQFLMKIRDFIHRNIDDGEMTVDDVVAQTTYSRRLFYNKIKSLTSLAPVDFIREVRLRYAASLLQAQDCRIKEITYMVGFSDIRYFTKCFRELFGVTPSHYRSQFQNKQI